MTEIDRLNQKFSDCLGTRGGQPWFAWKYAPDLLYEHRDQWDQPYSRVSWGSRLGKSWVLCAFLPPEVSREAWTQEFNGELPYPERGRYVPFPETAISRPPSMEDTVFYIRTLAQQYETSLGEHLSTAIIKCQDRQDSAQKKFFDMVDDDFPAFWRDGQGHEPGTRGAHVSIGGV